MTIASLFLSHPSYEENVADTRVPPVLHRKLALGEYLGKGNGVPPAEMREAPFYVCISDQTEPGLEIPCFYSRV